MTIMTGSARKDETSCEWDQFTESDNTDMIAQYSSDSIAANEQDFENNDPVSIAEIQQLRQQANQIFAQHEYDGALALYSTALKQLSRLQPQKPQQHDELPIIHSNEDGIMTETMADEEPLELILLCNRSACYYKMELFQKAKEDAAQAIRISKNYYCNCSTLPLYSLKAYFRLARAMLSLKEFHAVISTLETALDPHDSSLSTNTNTNTADLSRMKAELAALLVTAKQQLLQQNQGVDQQNHSSPPSSSSSSLSSVPSIRDFTILKELGEGNFSRVVIVSHKSTQNQYALKIMDKKRVEQLHKRQHPNVYQEIAMEQRILLSRLGEKNPSSSHPENNNNKDDQDKDQYKRSFIVHMYHAFQDYNHFYFLMELHSECEDLWNTMRWTMSIPAETVSTTPPPPTKRIMVGTHASLAKVYLYEILSALEFIHSRGIVHRDLKPENVLLSRTGHVVLIDFGTAKDLIHTDLNGPEFVGTPEFMSPETLYNSTSRSHHDHKRKSKDPNNMEEESNTSLDLWAFGILAYHLLTGTVPFWSPSPFLTYLKIQRGNIYRSMGIVDDDAWDLIQKLVVVDPKKRLGAFTFQGNIVQVHEYTPIREHPYFASIHSQYPDLVSSFPQRRPIPSLRDLCIRACSIMIQQDSYNIHLDTLHPPGDGSNHDLLRLNAKDRASIMHVLDKMRILSEPRIYRRFFFNKQETRWNKVRPGTCDYIGLTQMNDKQGQFPVSSQDESQASGEFVDVTARIQPIQIIHLSNPLFLLKEDEFDDEKDDVRSLYMEQLKQSIKRVNQIRPKVVVASGYIHERCKKVLSKVNESIPVILNDGIHFFSFWLCGAQGLVLRSRDFLFSENPKLTAQYQWLAQELEQSQMSQHPSFAFVECAIDQVPPWLIQTLAKGKVLCLFGLLSQSNGAIDKEYVYQSKDLAPHEEQQIVDDDSSTSSDEGTTHVMRLIGRGDSSLRSIILEEGGEWNIEHVY